MKTKQLLLTALALTLPLAGAHAALISTNTALSPGDLTYEGADLIVSNCTLTVDGVHSFASLLLTDSAVLTHSPAPAGETNNRLDLAITGALTIDATSRVDVNAKGYGPLAGPGAGTNSYENPSGGGHGGPGGNAAGGIGGGGSYDDLLAPTVWGSGGGNMGNGTAPGGAGGGWVRLSVGGVLTVAGQLTANGESVWASGGAGGSIQVNAGTLAGSGSITANGGAAGYGQSGGGGGGRIALYYGNSTFSGGLTALGGLSASANSGGAGTLYTKANSQSVGDLLLDNSGRTNAMETPITAPVAYRLTLTNAMAYVTEPLALTSLRVSANGFLTHLPAQLPGLDLTVTGDVTIDAGGAISADRKGYGQVAGPGAGTNDYYYASGGGHGGLGGNGYYQTGGGSYGALLAPTTWGSGGGSMPTCGGNCPGGAGGGRVRLSVGGVLTVAGQLTANGESVWAGGGAGGSIHLTVGTLAGNGSITANGGSAGYVLSGGGGGGRIAIYYGNSTFSGGLTALGGFSTSANSGGAGTLYTKANSQSVGDLLVDNSGRTNAMETPITTPVAYRLTLTNATAYATNLTLTSLRVSANGLLTHPFQGPRLQVLVQGNAVVEGGGAIAADARGYPSQTGPGKGLWQGGYYGQGAGAGHGGQGGACWSGPGGVTYDSETEPMDFGSGGGGSTRPNRGGGAIQLTVAGTLTIDGRVSANADAVTGGYDGGGAGGSVWLTASRLNGSGTITANGQVAGYPGSGSGGGGRIAIYTGVNEFAGAVAANGGVSSGGGSPGADGSRHYGTNVPTGLISWWRGEGDASDTMGVHHGTALGGLAYAPGQLGQAFVLNGQNAAVALGNWFNLQQFTISFWVNPAASQVQWADILDNNHTDQRSWVFQSGNNSSGATSRWSWGAAGVAGDYYWLSNSAWQHVVATMSSDHVTQLYVNGESRFNLTGAGPVAYDGTQFMNLGKHHLLGRYFNGLVDELMCFNRPLSPSEVASLYFNQGGPLQLSIQPVPGGVLLAWPASAASFGLSSRTNLTAGAWESVTNAPSLNGNRKEVLLPANTPVQRFFRLAQ